MLADDAKEKLGIFLRGGPAADGDHCRRPIDRDGRLQEGIVNAVRNHDDFRTRSGRPKYSRTMPRFLAACAVSIATDRDAATVRISI